MESLVVLAATIKKREISETIKNMDPFLNINEQEGIYFYRSIIILKMLFANYSMMTAIPKSLTLGLLLLGNISMHYITPADSFPGVYLLFFLLIVYVFPRAGNRFELPTLLICTLAMNIKPYECLIDLYVVFCIVWYYFEAYSREFQKLATVMFFMLSIGWCICNDGAQRSFTSTHLITAILFLILSYLPLIPNPQTKHRHRLLYLYAVMFLWVLYKFNYYNYGNSNSDTRNISDGQMADIGCHKVDNSTRNAIEYASDVETVEKTLIVTSEDIMSSYVPREIYTESPVQLLGEHKVRKAKQSIAEKGFKLFGLRQRGTMCYEHQWNADDSILT